MTAGACVDEGTDPSAYLLVPDDHEGDPRPAGLGWDIGWDEAP